MAETSRQNMSIKYRFKRFVTIILVAWCTLSFTGIDGSPTQADIHEEEQVKYNWFFVIVFPDKDRIL